ncbi:TetR family transcriptional regulator [Luteimicrobium sp. NPDC057192]|uniref:TetR/AcrR family transcriptional regulator n=1 Tax=Luteimicrobium sp. NPDC057192 TaxID=3346042 RepID=UPI0036412743
MPGDVRPGQRRRRGRRPAGEDTRAAILDAACSEFAERGFDATSVRGVARRAGVDPALVRHYFDSKADLLAAGLVPQGLDPRVVLGALGDGPRDTMGERLARLVLAVWDTDEGRARLRTVLSGALSADPAAGVFVDYLRRTVFGSIASVLDAPDADVRVALVASQVVGLLVTRVVIGLEPVASLPRDDVARLVGPTLQRYLTGDLAVGVDEEQNSSHGE